MERGLFQAATFDDLLSSPLEKLQQDEAITKQAMFLCRKTPHSSELNVAHPMRASGFTAALQQACGDLGITKRVTMYGFRREAITSFARNASIDLSREVALHSASNLESFGRYDYGFSDLDITSIRFADNARNRIREFMESPALSGTVPSTKDEYDHKETIASVSLDEVDSDDHATERDEELEEELEADPDTTEEQLMSRIEDYDTLQIAAPEEASDQKSPDQNLDERRRFFIKKWLGMTEMNTRKQL
ncbi:hypothetical protein FQN54_005958 [Arachnomyces sp. PD_36]|nr:hypothetical protein FQN54_005958 [Arachnomyces sp. PD_36]